MQVENDDARAASGGTREVFAMSKSWTAGGTSPPVRRWNHSASCGGDMPRLIARRSDAGADHEAPRRRLTRQSAG